jgi:hypothetical protein
MIASKGQPVTRPAPSIRLQLDIELESGSSSPEKYQDYDKREKIHRLYLLSASISRPRCSAAGLLFMKHQVLPATATDLEAEPLKRNPRR